ncbi:MAG TPA: SufE family protein, partial [Sphingomonadales bacterium]
MEQSVMMPIDEILENFALLDEWEERYRFVIDLGRDLPPFPDDARTEENRVRGCTSRVWLISEADNGKLAFRGDSDAHI